MPETLHGRFAALEPCNKHHIISPCRSQLTFIERVRLSQTLAPQLPRMKRFVAGLLIILLAAISTLADDSGTEQTQQRIPNILEDPLLHIGFAWKDIGSWTEQAAKDVKGELDKVDLGDAGKWLDQAGKDIGAWTQQAAKDVKGELDKIDLGDTGKWLDQAGKDIGSWTQQALKDISSRD